MRRLEPLPKWQVFNDVLKEAREASGDGGGTRGGRVGLKDAERVLVVVKDEQTASVLRDVILFGAGAYMEHVYKRLVTKRAVTIQARIRKVPGTPNSPYF